MKFCIVGAGATGGFLGAHLARAGEDVTLVARGPHLAAMEAHGVQVHSPDGDFVAHPKATGDVGVVRDADVVFLTIKAHGLTQIAQQIGPLLGPETAVVPAQNGLPWWYFQHSGGPLEGTHLESVDPGGVIEKNIETRRVLGCVVYPATEIVEPGVIKHIEETRFTIAELDDSRTERRDAVVAALNNAGLKSASRTRLRQEIWLKLLGNVAFNPISALTRATLQDIATFPETRAVARAVMEEANAVAQALGVTLSISVDQRLAGAESVGAHKTSMLQDVETGRPLEVEALVGAVVEVADLLKIEVPHMRTVYATTKLLDDTLRRARETR
jgi:2-dehydropantoate 2-reductase